MKTYIGTKIVCGEPEVKDSKEGYKVVYDDGYVSWSPKEIFERCYRPITNGEEDLISKGLA